MTKRNLWALVGLGVVGVMLVAGLLLWVVRSFALATVPSLATLTPPRAASPTPPPVTPAPTLTPLPATATPVQAARPVSDTLTPGLADGYGSSFSVAPGGQLDLHISSTAPTYSLRVTHATATGWMVMTLLSDLPGTYYPCAAVGVPAGQEAVRLGCSWPVATRLTIPDNWPSGLYEIQVAAPGESLGKFGNYIPFVVTPRQPGAARMVVELPTNTWEAYNDAGGWSFYNSPSGSGSPARRVTFDRPLAACAPDNGCWGSFDSVFVHWLEGQGLAADYTTDQEVANHPELLSHYALLIIPGHAEYWTAEMRDAVDAFTRGGGNVAILSGNTAYRQVRYQDDEHTLVCYKEDWRQDPLYGDDNHRLATEFSRSPWPNWPQNTTIGLGWMGYLNHSPGDPLTGQYTIYRAGSWVFAGTGLRKGDTFTFEPSHDTEVDGLAFALEGGEPVVTGTAHANYTLLGVQTSSLGHATLALFTPQPGGGTVFNAAATTWVRGLSPATNPRGYQVVQRITRNVIDHLAGGEN